MLYALTLVRPKRLTHLPIKQELILAAAGATGVFGYYLLENIALTYTMASNVGVIAAVAPFFCCTIGMCSSQSRATVCALFCRLCSRDGRHLSD